MDCDQCYFRGAGGFPPCLPFDRTPIAVIVSVTEKLARRFSSAYRLYVPLVASSGVDRIIACACFLSVMRTISPPSAFVRMISEPAGTVFTPYTSTLDFEFDAGISSISLDDATNTLPPSIRIPSSASSPVSAPVVGPYTISVPPVT